jgi:hypothetical protein
MIDFVPEEGVLHTGLSIVPDEQKLVFVGGRHWQATGRDVASRRGLRGSASDP